MLRSVGPCKASGRIRSSRPSHRPLGPHFAPSLHTNGNPSRRIAPISSAHAPLCPSRGSSPTGSGLSASHSPLPPGVGAGHTPCAWPTRKVRRCPASTITPHQTFPIATGRSDLSHKHLGRHRLGGSQERLTSAHHQMRIDPHPQTGRLIPYGPTVIASRGGRAVSPPPPSHLHRSDQSPPTPTHTPAPASIPQSPP